MTSAQSTTYELPNAKRLHRWTDRDGNSWACMEYDHGPMCRRCQSVDDVLAACLENVIDGHMEARQTDQGFEFKMTDEGNRQAARLIERLGAADAD